MNVNDSLIDAGPYEVEPDVYVFHFGVGMWVMHACHCPLIVTV